MDKVVLTASDTDSLANQGNKGLLSLDYEGWYYLVLEGTLGGSTTVTPYIQPRGANVYDLIEHQKSAGTLLFNTSSRRVFLVPGNCDIKFIVATYAGSSNLVARRIRAAKGA